MVVKILVSCTCVYQYGGGNLFPKNWSPRRVGIDTNMGGGYPFFEKLVVKGWYRYQLWGGGVKTLRLVENGVGTQWVGILNWYHPLFMCVCMEVFKIRENLETRFLIPGRTFTF